MPAADMIASGAIDQYISAYQRCRDGSLARSCYDYAQRRLESLYPSESTVSLQAVANQGREAVSRGQRINRNSGQYRNTSWSPLDPSETLRRARGATPLRYTYGVSVGVSATSRDGTVNNIVRNVVIIDRVPLSKAEIEQRAIAEAERLARLWETNSERLQGKDIEPTYTVRVESAYRSRD